MTAPVGEVRLGLLRTAGLDLALPLTALREVVPCPDELGDVPAEAVGLLGVMTLRGSVVPVLDLAQALGRPHERSRSAVVVVLAHEGRVLGLLVDEVRGMTALPEAALVEVTGGRLFSRTFLGEDGRVVSTLDPGAVLALPGVPVVREPERAAAPAPAARGRTRSLTIVRCGAFSLALETALVHSTTPTPVLRPSPADGPVCLGVTPVAGAVVAVADVLALLGLGALAGTPLDCGLVLDLPDGQVVLGVGAMVGLHEVPEDRVVPLPPSASPAPHLLPRVADVPGVGACLLLDGERLLADPAVVALSRIGTADDDALPEVAARAAVGGPPHLAYEAGATLVTDLAQVVEVLDRPADLVPARGARHVLGVVVHRGAAVPVLDLADALGRPATGGDGASGSASTSRLLLVEVDGDPAAWAVSGLHAILPLAWRDPAPARPSSSPLRSCPLVQLATAEPPLDGLLPLLDLHALTRAVRGSSARPDAPASVPVPRGEALVTAG